MSTKKQPFRGSKVQGFNVQGLRKRKGPRLESLVKHPDFVAYLPICRQVALCEPFGGCFSSEYTCTVGPGDRNPTLDL
jgi:hypothetical protein